MLYNVKLNEFSMYQLQMVSDLVIDKIDDLNRVINRLSGWDDSQMKHDLYLEATTNIDHLLLWKVQIENAMQDIKESNKVNSN